METLSPRFRFPLGLEAAELATVKPHRFPRFGGGMKTAGAKPPCLIKFTMICFNLRLFNSYTAYSPM
jgi:hypothetical protein